MANLNEDVLRYIFDYLKTPLEWVQVSEVCQLWKLAARKQWRKIKEISYLNSYIDTKIMELSNEAILPVKRISAKDAERMVRCAAPFVEFVSGTAYFTGKEKLMMLGTFLYEVGGFKPDPILKILAQEATQIDTIRFDRPPRGPLLKSLMDSNKIIVVKFLENNAFHLRVPTDDIILLTSGFHSIKDVKSFEGHFPNLKIMDLYIDCKKSIKPGQMLSPILPYTLGLSTLHLTMRSKKLRSVSSFDLLNISKLTRLHQLSLVMIDIHVASLDDLFNKLAIDCPKLRTVKIDGQTLCMSELRALLTLPRLQKVELDCLSSLQSNDLPEVKHLTQLHITYRYEDLKIQGFCKSLQRMPGLKIVGLKCLFHFSGSDDKLLKLVCGVASVAVSQKKNFILEDMFLDKLRSRVRIAKTNSETSNVEVGTMKFVIDLVPFDGGLVESLKSFVRKKFGFDYVVTVKYPD